MRNPNEEPRGGSMLLMTVLVTVLAAKVDPIVADIAIVSLTWYAMYSDSRNRK